MHVFVRAAGGSHFSFLSSVNYHSNGMGLWECEIIGKPRFTLYL